METLSQVAQELLSQFMFDAVGGEHEKLKDLVIDVITLISKCDNEELKLLTPKTLKKELKIYIREMEESGDWD
jgi:hypothetical protein